MHHPDFKQVLVEKFGTAQADQIVAFLERGFSPNGELVVASVFLYAKEAGKSLEQVLAVCEDEWQGSWQYRHPELRGNPDAPGSAGYQNRISLATIYDALGIANPCDEVRKITKEN